jgi:alginate O-acetyltransferase complex protein AlgI
MLFNSIPFALFLPLVFVLYWAVQKANLRVQNAVVLLASSVFYGMWDWRFVVLLFVSTAVDYRVGILLSKASAVRKRKLLLWLSVLVNLLLLGFFKYYDFFVTSFADMLGLFGLHASMRTLGLLMPVGISFYTFKKLSYTIDVYKERLEPTRDWVAFFAFVSFFPQLLAGPIDRGTTLLPQFLKKRVFSDSLAKDGLRQMLSGFMKKLVIADNLIPMVNELFTNYSAYDGLSLVIGIFFAAMQLYCDFSGYSDIAIGIGKLLGFRLMQNFAFPFFSRDIAEFWRRWHISLSTWLRDYLYVPLCGNRPSRQKKAFFIVVTFTLCGLWHEAAWTYVFWGFLHGLYFLPMTLKKRHPRFIGTAGKGRLLPSFRETRAMIWTFIITSFAWVFFMGDSFKEAFGIIARVASHPFMGLSCRGYLPMLLACFLLLVLEWFQREKEFFLQIGKLPLVLRWCAYYVSILVILVFGVFGSTEFMYTQF